MTNIKNLVFDFGGVLCKIDLQHSADAFKRMGFSDVLNYMNPYAQKGFFGDLEAGKISGEEFRAKASQHCGHEVTWNDCQTAWRAFHVGMEQANLDWLVKLRQEGYNLALLSNTNPFMAGWFRSDQFDGRGNSIDHYIPRDRQYLSYELKCMKPGREIFERMLAGTGFRPEQTVFIDDGKANLEAAASLGMHTFQPENGESWGSRLNDMLKTLG